MKNVVIIGGSSGISKSIVEKLDNSNIFLYSRNNENNSNYNYTKFDVINDDLDEINFPDKIDSFVYAPGSINLKPVKALKDEDILNDLRINVLGAFKIIQKIINNLRKSDNASILLFSTVAVQYGMRFHSSIAISKGAVEGLVKSLAAELAPKIRVNAIAPSLTGTPLAENLLNSDKKIENSKNMHALKRITQADEIADTSIFLMNNKAITGQIIGVNNGLGSVSI